VQCALCTVRAVIALQCSVHLKIIPLLLLLVTILTVICNPYRDGRQPCMRRCTPPTICGRCFLLYLHVWNLPQIVRDDVLDNDCEGFPKIMSVDKCCSHHVTVGIVRSHIVTPHLASVHCWSCEFLSRVVTSRRLLRGSALLPMLSPIVMCNS
jgi:hypothetical protein